MLNFINKHGGTTAGALKYIRELEEENRRLREANTRPIQLTDPSGMVGRTLKPNMYRVIYECPEHAPECKSFISCDCFLKELAY